MYRILSALILLTIFCIVAPTSAAADTVKLKSGQVHEGVITAEEEERVQLKLEGSGVRIWFDNDQILSIEITEPEESSPENDDPDDSASDTTGLDDDATRARKLLEKMREQSKNAASEKKNKINVKPVDTQPEETVAPAGPSETEVEKLISQMRNGKNIYDQMNACKKLGALEVKEAIPHLIHMLDDKKFMLREEANRSLVKITGMDFHFNAKASRSIRVESINKWEEWYKEEKKKAAEAQFKSLW